MLDTADRILLAKNWRYRAKRTAAPIPAAITRLPAVDVFFGGDGTVFSICTGRDELLDLDAALLTFPLELLKPRATRTASETVVGAGDWVGVIAVLGLEIV